jgi:hypothetical protein
MPAQKVFPGGLPALLWCQFDPMLLVNLSSPTVGKIVPHIGQCDLDSPIAPILGSSAIRTKPRPRWRFGVVPMHDV